MPKTAVKYVCCHCGEALPEDQFYKSYSQFYINKHLPICKDCFNRIVKLLLENETYKSSKKAMQRMCMAFDIYFDEDLFDKCDTHEDIYVAVGNYMKRLNLKNYAGKTFETTLQKGEILSGDRKPVKEKRVAIVDQYGNESDESQKINPKDIEKWGAGLEPEDYNSLNSHYKYLKASNPDCDSNQEIFINDLCYIKMQQMKAMRDGRVDDFNKLTESYRKSFAQACLKVVRDANATEDTLIGVNAEMIERYTPAEYYKDKSLYRDFDGIGDYMQRFVLRPLRNLMHGTKDRDFEFYVKDEEDAGVDNGED